VLHVPSGVGARLSSASCLLRRRSKPAARRSSASSVSAVGAWGPSSSRRSSSTAQRGELRNGLAGACDGQPLAAQRAFDNLTPVVAKFPDRDVRHVVRVSRVIRHPPTDVPRSRPTHLNRPTRLRPRHRPIRTVIPERVPGTDHVRPSCAPCHRSRDQARHRRGSAVRTAAPGSQPMSTVRASSARRRQLDRQPGLASPPERTSRARRRAPDTADRRARRGVDQVTAG
jgi:hypothetical protein